MLGTTSIANMDDFLWTFSNGAGSFLIQRILLKIGGEGGGGLCNIGDTLIFIAALRIWKDVPIKKEKWIKKLFSPPDKFTDKESITRCLKSIFVLN